MDSLKNLISSMIVSENPKRPFTDSYIAEKLGVSRGNITLVRKSVGIPDSRERLRPYLWEAVKRLNKQGLSARAITGKLKEAGFDVSRFVVTTMIAEVEDANSHQNDSYNSVQLNCKGSSDKESSDAGDPFQHIIGYDGSLAPQVELAKAAVLYPPKGLHTLIVGPSGTGKNELTEAMFLFAKKVRKQEIPFIHFNCADYSNNPQLILSQLFGYVKGAFTGADGKKDGLVTKADGGFLFLDEVHRLPAEGQEILFQLIDSNRFRRLGETENNHEVSVTIIAATTENPESSLLPTFRRRIPMIIEMPPLAARSLKERLALIRQFFRNEATRTETVFKVRHEALKALLLYDCVGNVGQLKSDVQVASAKSFLVHLSEDRDDVEIDVVHLSESVRRGLLKIAGNRSELDKVLSDDLVIYPSRGMEFFEKTDVYTLPGQIYHFMESRYQQLKSVAMGEEEINKIIGDELERQLRQHIKQWDMYQTTATREDLIHIVGEKLVHVVEEVLEYARQSLPLLNNSILQCLALHFHVAFDRLKSGQPIKNPYLDRVKKEYVREWEVGIAMAKKLATEMNIPIPEDEIGFLAMYLRGATAQPEDQNENRVRVLVIMHGRGIASGMTEVAARLLGLEGTAWMEMSLDEEPSAALERASYIAKEIDQGKGVLLLVDMGSLLTFGEFITKKTGVPTRTIGKSDTTMVIEAVRKAEIASMTLDGIYYSLVDIKLSQRGKKVVLVTCITGRGLAYQLARDLEKKIQGDDLDIAFIACSPIEVPGIVQRIGREKVVAVVGSVNPVLKGVKFFDAGLFARGSLVRELTGLLSATTGKPMQQLLTLKELISCNRIFLDSEFTEPSDVIKWLTKRLEDKQYVSTDFVQSVLERERMVPTYFGFESAVPHGDSKYVLHPAMAIARLRIPCKWGDNNVKFVFLVAATPICSKAIVQLYNQMADLSVRRQLHDAETPEDFARILLNIQ